MRWYIYYLWREMGVTGLPELGPARAIVGRLRMCALPISGKGCFEANAGLPNLEKSVDFLWAEGRKFADITH